MLGNRQLIVDSACGIAQLLQPWTDSQFSTFQSVESVPGNIYLFGRQQLLDNKQRIIEMAESDHYTMIFCDVCEGSWTLQSQVQMLGIEPLIQQHKILLISGGEQQTDYPYIQYDHFLIEILNYETNLTEMTRINEIFDRKQKPYKFLFLNGRARPHRKYLYERFKQLNLLDQSLWTMLESRPCFAQSFELVDNDVNLMATVSELKWLPKNYEVDRYQNATITPGPAKRAMVKQELFNHTWGEIYLRAEPYIDTYFSLVTETVFEQPWPFRTEKIAKPLMMGHPFVVASGPGFYQDLHRLGFQTFGHLIDESFDSIDNHRDRIERIITVVSDLCQQDLDSFLAECYTVCKYNQQHLQNIAPRLKAEFPERFINFMSQHE